MKLSKKTIAACRQHNVSLYSAVKLAGYITVNFAVFNTESNCITTPQERSFVGSNNADIEEYLCYTMFGQCSYNTNN